MQIENFTFGQISVDGATHEHDIVIDRGEVRERKKKPSKKFKADFGHTPLSVQEKIPWECERLVIGTGAHGNLPVMKEVKREAMKYARTVSTQKSWSASSERIGAGLICWNGVVR